VDIMGLVVMAVAKFGWAKPVPINMRRFKNPKLGMALTALAGPASNLLLTLIAMLFRAVALAFYYVSKEQGLWHLIYSFFEYIAVLSAGLAVFNLFPVPPLDGSKVLFSILPQKWYAKLMRVERYGMILLAVLLLTDVLDKPLYFLRSAVLDGISYMVNPVFYLIIERLL